MEWPHKTSLERSVHIFPIDFLSEQDHEKALNSYLRVDVTVLFFFIIFCCLCVIHAIHGHEMSEASQQQVSLLHVVQPTKWNTEQTSTYFYFLLVVKIDI